MREASSVGLAATVFGTVSMASTALDLRNTLDGKVSCELSVTAATTTQVDWYAYVSGTVTAAATPLYNQKTRIEGTITGTRTWGFVVDASGYRYLRIIADTSTGGATGATDAFSVTYRYNDYVSSASTDGALRVE